MVDGAICEPAGIIMRLYMKIESLERVHSLWDWSGDSALLYLGNVCFEHGVYRDGFSLWDRTRSLRFAVGLEATIISQLLYFLCQGNCF